MVLASCSSWWRTEARACRAREAERLFEPFYRGTAAREQGLPGSGLGLSLVRRVAEAHGGRVSVGAGPGGRGAAFTLHLPLASVETRG